MAQSPEQQRGSLTWLWIVLGILGLALLACLGVGFFGLFAFRSAASPPVALPAATTAPPPPAIAARARTGEQCKALCWRAHECAVPAINDRMDVMECEFFCVQPPDSKSDALLACLDAAADCATAVQCR
jgi:hypothetical protein